MYGGVSLAIYINGVSREFFDLVQGRGVYGLLKQLTDSDVVIDILSGTSAGGVNAILLAYALTNNKDFGDTADFWRRYGDIEDLLRRPEEQEEPDGFRSVLDGDYYRKKLEQAFSEMRTIQSSQALQDSEVDLFVTGTNVAGRVYTVFDEKGYAIDVKDHRAVFHLKHRPGRKEPFNPLPPSKKGVSTAEDKEKYDYKSKEECFQSLSKLARLTSSFPVAFGPVDVNTGAESGSDKFLTHWGRLDRWTQPQDGKHVEDSPTPKAGTTLYFMDGGLLDNKPFTHTISEIFNRTAERQVERYLMYVEPDPERFSKQDAHIEAPSLMQAAIAGALSIRTYESIADDVKLLDQHNGRVEQYAELKQQLRNSENLSFHAERESNLSKIFPDMDTIGQIQFDLVMRTRLTALRDRALKGIIKKQGRDCLFQPDEKKEIEELAKQFMDWDADGTDTLQDMDVYFRLRRLQHLVYRIHDVLFGDSRRANSQDSKVLTDLWQILNRHIKYLEIVQFWMERSIDEWPIEWRALYTRKDMGRDPVWQVVSRAVGELLKCSSSDKRVQPLNDGFVVDQYLKQELLDNIHKEFKAKRENIKERLDNGELIKSMLQSMPIEGKSALEWSDGSIERLFAAMSANSICEELQKEFHNFVDLDAFLYPMDYLSGLTERDVVKLIRLSPLDVKGGFNSGNRSVEKLAGRTLAHFGGFLKQSWRANDILWGRLDTVSKLIEMLLEKRRLQNELTRPDRSRTNVNDWFPKASVVFPEEVAAVQWWIDTMPHALQDDSLRTIREHLVAMAHYEIVCEEAAPFLASVLDQQFKWQTGTVRIDENETCFEGRLSIPADPVLARAFTDKCVEVNAEALKDESCNASSSGDSRAQLAKTKLGTFFNTCWEDIRGEADNPLKRLPSLVVASLAIQTAVVLRNCLLHEVPEGRRSFWKSQKWYRFLFGFPLDTALVVVRSWRQEPIALVVMRTIGIVLPLGFIMLQVLYGHIGDQTTKGSGHSQGPYQPAEIFWLWILPLFVLWVSLGRWRGIVTVSLIAGGIWAVMSHWSGETDYTVVAGGIIALVAVGFLAGVWAADTTERLVGYIRRNIKRGWGKLFVFVRDSSLSIK